MAAQIDDPFGLLGCTQINEPVHVPTSRFHVNHNICDGCGDEMLYNEGKSKYSCRACGIENFGEHIPDEHITMNSPGQFKIIGENSQQLQPYFYRNEKSAIQVKKSIFEEYNKLLELYKEKVGKSAFPLNAITKATEYYYEFKKFEVRRTKHKRWVMAKCLQIACNEIKYAPCKTDLIDMFELPNLGLSPGMNLLLNAASAGALSFPVNFDPREAEIFTLFKHIGELITEEEHEKYMDVVLKIINHATDMKIGSASLVRSKVVGTTYVVLSRRINPEITITINALCKFGGIRKNTVDRFIRELTNYHSSQFKQFYEAAGLHSN